MIDPAEITARLETFDLAEWTGRPAITRHSHGEQIKAIEALLSRVAVLEAQKQAALELHHEVTPFQNGTPECSYSGHVWPCGTFLALGGEETT